MSNYLPHEKFKDYKDEKAFTSLHSRCSDLIDNGNPLAALAIAQEMTNRWPKSPLAWLLSGAASFPLGKFDIAVSSFLEASKLLPLDETLSRGVFISAWRAGKFELAYAELERFVKEAGVYSKRYDLLLADLRGEVDPDEFDRRVEIILDDEKKNAERQDSSGR